MMQSEEIFPPWKHIVNEAFALVTFFCNNIAVGISPEGTKEHREG